MILFSIPVLIILIVHTIILYKCALPLLELRSV